MLLGTDLSEEDTDLYPFSFSQPPDARYAARFHSRGLICSQTNDPAAAAAFYSTAIASDPKLDEAWLDRGDTRITLGDYSGAIGDYQHAISRGDQSAEASYRLSKLLATCPDQTVRNGRAAVTYALTANEQAAWANARYLDALAGAYATTGDYDSAIFWQNKAVIVPVSGDFFGDVRREFENRLEGYRKARMDLEWSPVPVPGSEAEVAKLQGVWIIRSAHVSGEEQTLIPAMARFEFRGHQDETQSSVVLKRIRNQTGTTRPTE